MPVTVTSVGKVACAMKSTEPLITLPELSRTRCATMSPMPLALIETGGVSLAGESTARKNTISAVCAHSAAEHSIRQAKAFLMA